MAHQSSIAALPLSHIPPVQLWIHQGNADAILFEYLAHFFCKEKRGCKVCFDCVKLTQKRHASISFLSNPYTLESLTPIADNIHFIRDKNDVYFFIIPDSEKLLPATASALLKNMEEPPQGYYFILLSTIQEKILPTIVSRSVIFHIKAADTHISESYNVLIEHFTKIKPLEADQFLDVLESCNPDIATTAKLLTLLLEKIDTAEAKTIIAYHLSLLEHTANSNLIWKNIYLRLEN